MRSTHSLTKSVSQSRRYPHTPVCRSPRGTRSGSSRTLLPLLAAVISALFTSAPLRAAILPTEIYYNGPSPGADPDEFLELSNTGSTALRLQGFRFSLGIDLLLPDITLEPFASLIVAPNPEGFRARFPAFTGVLLDTRGSLSNSGEIIELLDAGGGLEFSLRYEDSGGWPRSADGGGDSLQLLGAGVALNEAASWFGATPDPGSWMGFDLPDDSNPGAFSPVPLPGTLALMLVGLAGWAGSRPRTARLRQWPAHRIHGRCQR